MYEAFYGFRERPFDLTPNPRFLLLTGKHREALSNLQYGLTSRRGLTLLIGDAGTGKTTLIRAVIQDYENQGALIAYLNNPTLTRPEFYEFLTQAFNLSPKAAASKAALLNELGQILDRRHAAGLMTGLVIDEAQAMPDELLEEVRLLANIETTTDKRPPLLDGSLESMSVSPAAPSRHARPVGRCQIVRAYFGALEPAFRRVKEQADVVRLARRLDAATISAAPAACAVGLLLSLALTSRVLRPLSVLRQAARRLGEGDTKARASVDGHDELADVAGEFNTMADRLSQYRASSLGELLAAEQQSQAAIDSLHPSVPRCSLLYSRPTAAHS